MRWLLAAALLAGSTLSAFAQSTFCPTRPFGDNTNACASTAFVQNTFAVQVVGPASATDNALVRFDGTTGKLIKNSSAILSDAGTLALNPGLFQSTRSDGGYMFALIGSGVGQVSYGLAVTAGGAFTIDEQGIASRLSIAKTTGAVTIPNTLALTPMTAGSVLFAGAAGVISQDNANFAWNAANHVLTLKTPNAVVEGTIPTATSLFIVDGSSGTPATADAATLSVSRRENINVTTNNAAAAFFHTTGTGSAQPVGVYGSALNTGTGDAAAVMGIAAVTGTAAMSAFGAYFEGRALSATTGAIAVETTTINNSGLDRPYSPVIGVNLAIGFDIDGGSSGGNLLSAAIQVRASSIWDVGLGFMQCNCIKSASIRDDTQSVTFADVRGTHTYAIDTKFGSFTGGNVIRLPNGNYLSARDFGDTADIQLLSLDGSNNIRIGDGAFSGVVSALGSFLPRASTTYDIGSTSLIWTNLYSINLQLRGATSGGLTVKTAAIAGANTLTLPAGTTDFSATGGASQIVFQTSSGGAFTVARPTCSTLSDAGTGCTGSSTAAGLTVGTSTITSGTTLRVLYDNAGVLGEYTNTQLTALINAATASLSGALPAWPNNATTFFRGDGTYTAVASAALNITTTSCTNQFVTAISSGAVGTCTTDTLASAQHANQGTTTTLLHGNAAGNPSFGQVVTADITTANVTYALIQNVAGLSVFARSATTSGVGADVTGTADQLLRIAAAGASLGFGSMDLSKSAAVGTSLLALANGGLNAALTASNGGIFYSTASAGAILSGTTTARQMLQSGASTTPAWSTTTWPATATVNRLLYASAANVISDLATANNGILVTDSGGVPSISSTPPSAVLTNITGRLIAVQTFSATATYTATSGAVKGLIRIWGPGGAGGGAAATGINEGSVGAGGGGGGYCEAYVTITSGVTVTIGTGGTAGTAGNNPGNSGSGSSTWGASSVCTAAAGTGGAGGAASATGTTSGAPGSGGAGTVGNALLATGGNGSIGLAILSAGVDIISGAGGAGALGGAGGLPLATTGTGNAGTTPGAGGGGGAAYNNVAARAGGAGANGYAVIYEFNFLLKRDLNPANDNSPMWLDAVA